MRKFYILLLTLFVCIVVTAQKVPFQGKLMDNGIPVNGTSSIVFSITDLSWSETHPSVTVTNGLYSVVLGSITPLPKDPFKGAPELALSISVDGQTLSDAVIYPPLPSNIIPRKSNLDVSDGPFVADDTAFYIGSTVDEILYGLKVDVQGNGSKIGQYTKVRSLAGDNNNKYGVYGILTGEGSGSHNALRGEVNASGYYNTGVIGLSYGPGDGTVGESGGWNTGTVGGSAGNSNGNTGVYGYNWGSTGTDNSAIKGLSQVTTSDPNLKNHGLWGVASGPGKNYGVWATAHSGTENWAGWFDGRIQVNSNDPNATYFWHKGANIEVSSPVNNTGLHATVNTIAESTAEFNVGVLGNGNGDAPGERWGVEGNVNGANSTLSAGVRGKTTLAIPDGSNSYGGLFQSAATGANGTAAAVRAEATGATAKNIGVWGTASGATENWAGWFDGDVKITGQLDVLSVNQTSDIRLKKDIKSIDNSLGNILKLRGVSYHWKNENMGNSNQIGLIAQEVEEVYPEFVHTKEDGYKSVNYAQMTAVLIEGLKELNNLVEKQGDQLKEQHIRITRLESENGRLMATLKSQQQRNEEMESLKAQVRKLMQMVDKVQPYGRNSVKGGKE